MKNLLIIAILLLGVAACSDRKEDYDNSPEKVSRHLPTFPGGNGMAYPPQMYCPGCAFAQYTPSRCAIYMGVPMCMPRWYGDDEDPQPITRVAINVINDSSNSTDLDTSHAKEYMNNYLWNFEKGVRYINYFEQIGIAIEDNGGIPILDIPMHYDFALATYAVADSIRNGQPSCVPISSEYKTDALAMIAYWRIRCDESYFQTSLDSITSDLNTFTGLTRAQIYGHFE